MDENKTKIVNPSREGKVTVKERELQIPNELKIVGVQNDNLVENVYFEIPKTFDEVNDLSTFELRVNWLNVNGDADSDAVEIVSAEGETIVFKWNPTEFLTKYEGTVKISIFAIHEDGRKWNSAIAELTVLKGIVLSDEIAKKFPSVIEDLLKRVSYLENHNAQMQKTKVYDTTIEMLSDESLKISDKVKTLGYEKIGDGGQAEFVIGESSKIKLQLNLTNGLFATLIADIPNTAQCPSKFIDMMKLYETVNVNCDLTLNESLTIDDSFKLTKLSSKKYRKYNVNSKDIHLNKSKIIIENLSLTGDGTTDGLVVYGSNISLIGNSIYSYKKAIVKDISHYSVNLRIINNEIGYCENGIIMDSPSQQMFSNLIIKDNYVVKCGNDVDNLTSKGNENCYGCFISALSNATVTGNIFEYNAGFGLFVKNYAGLRIEGLLIQNNYFENNKICNLFVDYQNGVYTNNVIGKNFYSNPYDPVENTMSPRNMNGVDLLQTTSWENKNNINDIIEAICIQQNMYDAQFMAENNVNLGIESNVLDKSNKCLTFSINKESVLLKLSKGHYKIRMHFINPHPSSPYVMYASYSGGVIQIYVSYPKEGWCEGEFNVPKNEDYRLLEQGGLSLEYLAYDALYCYPI